MSSAARKGLNESLFREVNERLADRADANGDGSFEIVCECDREECTDRIRISVGTYEAVRAHAEAFAVLDGHVDPECERVIASQDGFKVVEKFGVAAEVARIANPRNGQEPH
jgi:hypothetical protein